MKLFLMALGMYPKARHQEYEGGIPEAIPHGPRPQGMKLFLML